MLKRRGEIAELFRQRAQKISAKIELDSAAAGAGSEAATAGAPTSADAAAGAVDNVGLMGDNRESDDSDLEVEVEANDGGTGRGVKTKGSGDSRSAACTLKLSHLGKAGRFKAAFRHQAGDKKPCYRTEEQVNFIAISSSPHYK
uniref:AP2/ERF domain-containing protein n=1 Tax=Macrostomum lignano TaxID=282301 RepID=A0A1I8JIU4_9PLAT